MCCCANENLTTFLYTLNKGDKKTEGEKRVFFFRVYRKSNVIKKKLGFQYSVFSIWYLAYPMDKSYITF